MLNQTQQRILLMLSNETTISQYFLLEDEEFMELLEDGNPYEELLAHINEHY